MRKTHSQSPVVPPDIWEEGERGKVLFRGKTYQRVSDIPPDQLRELKYIGFINRWGEKFHGEVVGEGKISMPKTPAAAQKLWDEIVEWSRTMVSRVESEAGATLTEKADVYLENHGHY